MASNISHSNIVGNLWDLVSAERRRPRRENGILTDGIDHFFQMLTAFMVALRQPDWSDGLTNPRGFK